MEEGKAVRSSSVVRRNLQREHLRELAEVVLSGNRVPPDARSLARMHLQEIGDKVGKLLEGKDATLDDTTRRNC